MPVLARYNGNAVASLSFLVCLLKLAKYSEPTYHLQVVNNENRHNTCTFLIILKYDEQKNALITTETDTLQNHD